MKYSNFYPSECPLCREEIKKVFKVLSAWEVTREEIRREVTDTGVLLVVCEVDLLDRGLLSLFDLVSRLVFFCANLARSTFFCPVLGFLHGRPGPFVVMLNVLSLPKFPMMICV